MEKYLVVNAGSSSLKFSLYDMPDVKKIVSGIIERIGEDSSYTLKFDDKKISKSTHISNHSEAVGKMINLLFKNGFISDLNEIKGVGHRILHGGEIYKDSVLIDDGVISDIEELIKFGPIHHSCELAGIYSLRNLLPDVPQVAVFDTAFHQSIPEENYMYAIPSCWYEEYGVRKYGFHGMSHKYISDMMKGYYVKDNINLIICHIGSGASVSCIKNGQCFDTSMGLTPVDGLIMGTRCGRIDPSVIEYLCNELEITVSVILGILNRQSGLLGIAGVNDYRDLERMANDGDKKAILALNMFVDRVVDYIAEYYFKLRGNLDALVFTAGIGENSSSFRERVVNSISKPMGIYLDKKANDMIASFKEEKSGVISSRGSRHDVIVFPTDEEYVILEDTYNIVNKKNKQKKLGD